MIEYKGTTHFSGKWNKPNRSPKNGSISASIAVTHIGECTTSFSVEATT